METNKKSKLQNILNLLDSKLKRTHKTVTKNNIFNKNHIIRLSCKIVKGLFFIIIASTMPALAEDKIIITVNQFANHIALNKAYDGLSKALTDRGILPNKARLIYANAQGSVTNSAQISKHQAGFKPRFMVAIATPSAQTTLKAIDPNVSILAFLAVSDPQSAGLIRDDGVIGVSDSPPIRELLYILNKRFPDKKRIGVIFNSGETNSVEIVSRLEKISTTFGFEIKKVAISNSSDIKTAMNKIIDVSDFIYVPEDNSIVSALDSIINIAKAAHKPVIANDPSLVDNGVFMALGTNYFSSGQELGDMIADLIDGKDIPEHIVVSKIKEFREIEPLHDRASETVKSY